MDDATSPPRGHLSREGSAAAAIYGCILATSLLGAVRYSSGAGAIAVTLISTSAVFWIYSDRVGIDVALALAIAQLVGWGFLGARRMGAGRVQGTLVGAADGVFGLAIVGLEILLH